MKKLPLFLFLFFVITSYAQFSKTHYLPPITAQSGFVEDHYIYISTPSTKDVRFRIIENGGNVITGVTNNSNPYVHSIGRGESTQLFTPKNQIGIVKNKGYVIEAEDLIYTNIRVNAGLNSAGGYNHAGGLVSKGNSALGKIFRLGAMSNPLFDTSLLNFASILAIENGTKVTISNLPNGTILTNGTVINGPITVTLNKNESYVLALENYNTASEPLNSTKIIGALVASDKAVVVNTGSFCGSNSTELRIDGSPLGRDVGFDQIVPIERTGTEYIFVKGLGTDELEQVLLVAHSDLTTLFLNGSITPFATLNKGEYILINGSQFSNGSLYVTASEKVFTYQSIGGTPSPANQNMFFVPPLNCSTPQVVDNIPKIEQIGSTTYIGGLNIVTEKGATVLINNIAISSSPQPITGNPNFVRYTVDNLKGNIAVKSTKQVYVSYFATNGAATYGGYYSGFDLKPEIVLDKIATNTQSCIPNTVLKINTLSAYDTFRWYKDDVPIPSATDNNYRPTSPGYYQVEGSISGCLSNILSDKIPVSQCPEDNDNDGTNNAIDRDWDNDGLLNINESNFNPLNHATPMSSADYLGTITGSGTITGYPAYGFVSDVPAGKNNPSAYELKFTKPESINFQYITDGSAQTTPITDFANADGDFMVAVPTNQTLTIRDPLSQLLIDTNFDGIYESGVTEFTSFEIRFRLKDTTPAKAGTLQFSIEGYKIKALTFTHTNLSVSAPNRAAFQITIKRDVDNDNDGVPDAIDIDSDNDGIPDYIEAQGKGYKVVSGVDTNKDGLDDAFEPGIVTINSDTDRNGTSYYVKDVLDLDSDNDGIYDLVEAGHNAVDANKDGKVEGAVGNNGLLNTLETYPDSGILNYSLADIDGNGEYSYIDLDSDNDSCNDVIEAGFLDPDGDGLLGKSPVIVNEKGIITSSVGYTTPHPNYGIAAPIIINNQPTNKSQCLLQNVTFEIISNADSFQWQSSTDGVNWTNLDNKTPYSNVTSKELKISNISASLNGYYYRVQLSKTGNSCGLTSAMATLTVLPLPIVATNITLTQCDDDLDGITDFNLTEKNNFISANYLNETFTYFKTASGAINNDITTKILDPIKYRSGRSSVWARVTNANGCFSTTAIQLMVSATQIPATFKRSFSVCDDYLDATNDDRDGIATFNFSSVTNDIKALLPAPTTAYIIKYYPTQDDALAENNEITNPTSYRNTAFPNQQIVFARVDSVLDNACFGLGGYVTLTVEKLPNIDNNPNGINDKLVCSNLPTFYIQLNAGINDGSDPSNYTYVWKKDNEALTNQDKYTLDVNIEGLYSAEVTNNKKCSRTRTIKVVASDIAKIETIEVIDLTNINKVTITVSGQGDYQYSLDNPNGPFMDSNMFNDAPLGIHTIFVNDKNGCGMVSKDIAVIGAPRFFTPNGDGYNDYWNIKGTNTQENSKSVIHIFDRYGRLLKQIFPNTEGWNGTFNNEPLPADDYWFTLQLEDGRETKGHFTLKR